VCLCRAIYTSSYTMEVFVSVNDRKRQSKPILKMEFEIENNNSSSSIPNQAHNNKRRNSGSRSTSDVKHQKPRVSPGSSIHVAIIGGGIGGFGLAVALQQRGIRFTVYEKDQSFGERRQGYGYDY
jgi:hypothetical protein